MTGHSEPCIQRLAGPSHRMPAHGNRRLSVSGADESGSDDELSDKEEGDSSLDSPEQEVRDFRTRYIHESDRARNEEKNKYKRRGAIMNLMRDIMLTRRRKQRRAATQSGGRRAAAYLCDLARWLAGALHLTCGLLPSLCGFEIVREVLCAAHEC